MKKLFLTLTLALIFNALSALPTFICTSQGYLFYTYWYYDSQGNLAYTLESQGPGSCSGGPWTMFAVPISSGLDEGTLATAAEHDKFLTISVPIEEGNTDALKEAVALSGNVDPIKVISFDPNKIHPDWAKSFAVSNNLSIYSLLLIDHPFNENMNFDLWSIKKQTIRVSLISTVTGNEVWHTDMSLIEGKNSKNNIVFDNSPSGNYTLRIISDKNTIDKPVLIQ